jgi:hypothetical protein
MANPVIHFEVLGRGAQALQRFYGHAFGWRTQDVRTIGELVDVADGPTIALFADPEGHVVGPVKAA